MFASSVGESTGWRRPASLARQRLAASVVTSTSAGVSSPSWRSRSNRSGPDPLRNSTSMPVSRVKRVNTVSSPYCDRPL